MKSLNFTPIFLFVIVVIMMAFTPYRKVAKDISFYPKPNKKYTKEVTIAVKNAMKIINMYDTEAGLSSSIKSEVTKLTAYAKEGLDLALINYNISKVSKDKKLSAEQTEKILEQTSCTWNTRMKINEQKEILIQLKKEISSNLKIASELKRNTDHVLSSLQMISSDQVLRNPKIKILPVLFPIENISISSLKPVSELVETGLNNYTKSGLSSNKSEIAKFTSVGKSISLTLDNMLPNMNLLSDNEGIKYQVSSTKLNQNIEKLSSIGVFDIEKISQTFTGLSTLHTNYNNLVNLAIDYINDLNTCLKSGVSSISKENIQKFLVSERQTYEIIASQQKSLKDTIENLTKLERSMDETLKY